MFAALALIVGQTGQPPVDLPWPPPGVVDAASRGVAPPVPVHQVNPSYVPEAMREGIEGSVLLKCVVWTDGSVRDIRVARSLDPRLDTNAIAALKQWTFTPAHRAGNATPVPVAISVELGFHLKKPGDAAGSLSAWPAEFARTPDTTAWKNGVIDLPPLQLRISYPPTWRFREYPAGTNRVATVDNNFSTRSVSIGRPKPMAGGVSTMLLPRPVLENAVRQIMEGEFDQGRPGTLNTFGQVETSSGVWMWMDLDLRLKDLPNASPVTAIYDRARMWMFAASIEGQYIPVMCTMLVPANPTPEHRQEQLEQTTAEFAGIMRHLSIGHR